MMLDKSFYALDPHFTSCTGMLTALRVQYEFFKIRRCGGEVKLGDFQKSHARVSFPAVPTRTSTTRGHTLGVMPQKPGQTGLSSPLIITP